MDDRGSGPMIAGDDEPAGTSAEQSDGPPLTDTVPDAEQESLTDPLPDAEQESVTDPLPAAEHEPVTDPLLDAEQELARLRAEVERLRSMAARQAPPPGGRRRGRRAARWTAATAFLVIGCLLLPVAAIALWAKAVVFDTDRYVASVAPLASDPAVQDAVAARITDEVFAALNINDLTGRAIDALVKQGAPTELTALQQPIVNGIHSFAYTQVRKVVGSDAFAQAWEQANRAAHAGLVDALKGKQGGAIEFANGTVSVNLGPFIASIKPQLVAAGIPLADRIPTVNISFPIVHSDELPRIQRAAALLDTLAVPVAILAFLLLAVAVWVAPKRRRMLSIVGFGFAIALLALLGALSLGRTYYLGHLPPNSMPEAAAAVWDAFMQQFTVRLQTAVLVALVLALGAWVSGPGRFASALRSAAGRLVTAIRVGGLRVGWRGNAVDRWVAAHVTALRVAALAVIVGIYLLWDRPTGEVVIWLTVALLALLAVIELFSKGADLPVTDPGPSAVDAALPAG